MINLFKSTKPKTIVPEENELVLHHIGHQIPPDILISQLWSTLFKKWQRSYSWSFYSLSYPFKNFKDADYQIFLKDLLYLCKSHRLDQLKKFEFEFAENSHRLSTNFSILGRLFKEAIPNLQTLSLSFTNFQMPRPQDMNSLMMVIGRELCNLTKLSLSFEGCRLDDACLKMFESKNMGNNLKITTLELNFKNCLEISNEGFVTLFRKITRSFNKLKTLNLNLSKTCIRNMSIEKLMSLINQRLAHLEVLKLDFTSCKFITGTSLFPFVHKNGSSDPQLARISLIFDECPDFYDEGLCAVGNLVQKHGNTLKALYLSVNKCKRITERGLKVFANRDLITAENLKEAEFDFGLCPKVTDEVLEVFALGLTRLERLEKLGFSLFGCNGITDKGVGMLAIEIKKRLECLKDLKLDLLYVNHVTKEALNNILAMFETLPKLSVNFI